MESENEEKRSKSSIFQTEEEKIEVDLPRIKKLDPTVVNRIAAGEVIHRPANAVKELIENSLDAKATSIRVTIKSGGIKSIMIQDNGFGIHKEDLITVCERFTTSKLTKFEDLQSIGTYGFRGEALASISHIAQVTITSMTSSQPCAFRAQYRDGKIIGVHKDKAPEPKPVAGTIGTSILIEDLFYNVLTRQKTLKNPNEEYQRVYDVMARYAIHNSGVSFSLKKFGESGTLLFTSEKSSVEDNISTIFGHSITKELIHTSYQDDQYKYNVKIWMTNANFNSKKSVFILFINNRLVESSLVKKAVECGYGNFLPKGTHPFIYLSIQCDPKSIDVNVHPTKKEVHLLHETEIINSIQNLIQDQLKECNHSRTFKTQSVSNSNDLPIAPSIKLHSSSQDKRIRNDPKVTKLSTFLSSQGSNNNSIDLPSSEYQLTSIQNLLDAIEKNRHEGVENILKSSSFIGCVEPNLFLLQFSSKLYLVDSHSVSKELIYQSILNQFGTLNFIPLQPPTKLHDVLEIALEDPEVLSQNEIDNFSSNKEEYIQFLIRNLRPHYELLNNYFSIDIREGDIIYAIPEIFKDYIPDMDQIPQLFFRLSSMVEWNFEQQCFADISASLAYCYAIHSSSQDFQNKTQNFIIPKLKNFIPPTRFQTGVLFEITSLEKLYKVFERC